MAWLHLSFTEALRRLRAVVGACAGIAAGALLALWDLAAVRCAGVGSWCMRAVSGSLSSSSVHSGPDGSSQHYYQAVTEDLPSEYWVRSPQLFLLTLLLFSNGKQLQKGGPDMGTVHRLLYSRAMTNSLLRLLLSRQRCLWWQRPLKLCHS